MLAACMVPCAAQFFASKVCKSTQPPATFGSYILILPPNACIEKTTTKTPTTGSCYSVVSDSVIFQCAIVHDITGKCGYSSIN